MYALIMRVLQNPFTQLAILATDYTVVYLLATIY